MTKKILTTIIREAYEAGFRTARGDVFTSKSKKAEQDKLIAKFDEEVTR